MTGFVLLSLLSACNMVVDSVEEVEQPQPVASYINLTLYVNSGETTTDTRSPLGGEDGDAREAGFNRENTVSGITIILYKGSGIDDSSAKVDFVRYFTVTEDNLEGRDDQGTTYDYYASETYRSEARYTTGDQLIATGELDFSATYHVLLVANQDVSSICTKGTLISEVRDKVINNVFSITNPSQPWTAQQFVMTSERDATINFSGMRPVERANGNPGLVYRVMQPLLIERMSARIDYCTYGSTYDETLGGYKYIVGSSGDVFVVTKVTPFNLYNENEYLFKRVQDNWSAEPITSYLGDETISNYVIDPNTANKNNSVTFAYLNTLDAVNNALAGDGSTDYTQVMTAVQSTSRFTDASGKNNVIIAYPKENTLRPDSYLKKYATGLAFQGDYYAGGTGTPEKRVYYHYLRHQGELATGSYQAKQWADITETETCGTLPMNYGIVRNNIYRVEISGITESGLNIYIKVKKWDRFEHKEIYMK
jgi:hypothetical protein